MQSREVRLADLRWQVRELLESYGYRVGENWKLEIRGDPRSLLANFARLTNPKPDPGVSRYFAGPEDICPEKISPVIRPVEAAREKRIFRHALSFWSIPVSSGYGRRMRFILWDDSNGKVMGILGLCDPVIGLRVRDRYIGWDKQAKEDRLYHVMSAYVLGAVPPYNRFRGAKLVALLAGSSVVQELFRERYGGKRSVIRKKVRDARLVLVDTMGAFGKSAIYNRLKGWKFIGYTEGQSHYHLSSNGIYPVLVEALKVAGKSEILKKYRFGQGPNWKMRVVREAADVLGIPPQSLIAHGIRRAYYLYPLAKNWKDFLLGKAYEPEMLDLSPDELVEYWRERWLRPVLDRVVGDG